MNLHTPKEPLCSLDEVCRTEENVKWDGKEVKTMGKLVSKFASKSLFVCHLQADPVKNPIYVWKAVNFLDNDPYTKHLLMHTTNENKFQIQNI